VSLSSGNSTGNSSSGTGTCPHLIQLIIGTGTPQYLYLDTSQSFIQNSVYFTPIFCSIILKAASFMGRFVK